MNRTVNWCIGGCWFTLVVVGWNDPFFRTEEEQNLSNYEPQMYPLSSTSPRGFWILTKSRVIKMRNEEEIWSEFVKYLPCLFPLVFHYQTTSLHHEEEEEEAIAIASFPLSSVCPSRSLAMELLFNRSNKYFPNPLLSVGTYILGFSSLLFLSSAFHECCWHIFCPWHDSHTYCMRQFDRETLLTKNKGQSATMWCLCCSLVSFLKPENQRPFALKKAENEQLGLGNQDTSTLHMQASAHQSVAPTQSGASFVN